MKICLGKYHIYLLRQNLFAINMKTKEVVPQCNIFMSKQMF